MCYGADRDEAVARVQALALRVIAERLGAIDLWLGLPGTVIVFQFNRGKITKVETRDKIEGLGDP